jgi:hypothetical protein
MSQWKNWLPLTAGVVVLGGIAAGIAVGMRRRGYVVVRKPATADEPAEAEPAAEPAPARPPREQQER